MLRTLLRMQGRVALQVGGLLAQEDHMGAQFHDAAMPRAKGFGTIMGGVLQAAMASEVPGVLRIEEMHQQVS